MLEDAHYIMEFKNVGRASDTGANPIGRVSKEHAAYAVRSILTLVGVYFDNSSDTCFCKTRYKSRYRSIGSPTLAYVLTFILLNEP